MDDGGQLLASEINRMRLPMLQVAYCAAAIIFFVAAWRIRVKRNVLRKDFLFVGAIFTIIFSLSIYQGWLTGHSIKELAVYVAPYTNGEQASFAVPPSVAGRHWQMETKDSPETVADFYEDFAKKFEWTFGKEVSGDEIHLKLAKLDIDVSLIIDREDETSQLTYVLKKVEAE